MKAIALLTDFGLKDNFVGVMKGVITAINPKAKIIDICHSVSSYDINRAAFLLFASFSYFPKGTIFLAVVDPGVGSNRRAIAIKTENYYFIGPDNGILSLATAKDGIEKAVLLNNKKYFLKNVSSTFHARDIFAPIAAHISKGVNIRTLGRRINEIEKIKLGEPTVKGNILTAQIIYADKFGNLVTNITKKQFENFTCGKKFIAFVNGKKIENICSFYRGAEEPKPFFIEGSHSFLEVSLKNKSAKKYFALGKILNVKITITLPAGRQAGKYNSYGANAGKRKNRI
jgi:S-adenosylmethionine hydrolase